MLWNNKEVLIEIKTVFYRHYFDIGVIFTKDLLYGMTNTESFRAMKEQGLTNSFFLVSTGLRESVPSKLRVNIQNYIYYYYLIKVIYEKPWKWDKLGQEFYLSDFQKYTYYP